MHAVRAFENAAGNRRVIIFQRSDSTYGFAEEVWSDEPHERCWLPREAGSICDSEATAIREAQGRVDWFRDHCITYPVAAPVDDVSNPLNQSQQKQLDNLLWKRALGRVVTGDYVDWANQGLLCGLDTPHLRILAGLSPPYAWWEVEHYFARTLEDLGWTLPQPEEIRQNRLREIARKIVDGVVSPVEGCRELCAVLREWDYAEVSGDWFWFEDKQDPRTGARLPLPRLEAAIRQEAEALLNDGLNT